MTRRAVVASCLFFVIAALWAVDGLCRQAEMKSSVFFSQGQAVYNPQQSAKSKDDAIHDFLAQAVTQAVASCLGPAEMGGKIAPLQEKILKQPKRYIENFQLFEEGPSGGLYRVRGQATVAMETLKKDLAGSGLASVDQGRAGRAQSSQAEKPPSSGVELEKDRVGSASRGMSVAGPEVFWAVAERWEDGWLVPSDGGDPQSAFAMSVVQETSGYGWALLFPGRGGLEVDSSGDVPVDDVLSSAKKMGASKAVSGSVDLGPPPKRLLAVSLKVFDVRSGRPEGEIHKELALDGESLQEGAMDLAGVVAPQLDRLLGERSGREALRAEAIRERPRSDQGPGEWTVTVKGSNPYAAWEEVAKALEDGLSSMKVLRLDVGADAVTARIEGAEGAFLQSFQESALKSGSRVEVSGYSPELRSVTLTLSHP